MKRTPWYPGTVKPARVGVYERKWPTGVFYACWDGEKWRFSMTTVLEAVAWSRFASSIQDHQWRGLTKKAT